MENIRRYDLTALVCIFAVATLPAIVGPMLNIGQFMGGEQRFIPLLKKGIIPMLLAGFLGYLLFLRIANEFRNKRYESRWQICLEGSLIIYFPLLIAWSLCQVFQLAIEYIFTAPETANWYDAILGTPIIIWFALFPCAIAALCFGLVLMLILKKN